MSDPSYAPARMHGEHLDDHFWRIPWKPVAFLYLDYFGTPLWAWLLFGGLVTALLVFDLGVLHRKTREIPVGESLFLSAGYITVALLFGAWTWWVMGAEAGMDYLTAFLVEKSLSLDNVFVISLIFATLAVPRHLQHRVLFYGIVASSFCARS